MEYTRYDVHYTLDNNDEIVYVDTVKARTEKEAANKILKKFKDFNPRIKKVTLF